ncbi:MAG: AAA family ATPase [Candidatus Heimdallarchaeaceae archaeon]
MIFNLSIANFKSIKHITLECSRVNILIGRPNTGKSNILEALGLFTSVRYVDFTSDQKNFSKDILKYEHLMNLFFDNNVEERIKVTMDSNSLEVFMNREIYHIKLQQTKEKQYSIETHSNESCLHEDKIKIYDNYFPSIKFYRFKQQDIFKKNETEFFYPPIGQNLVTLLKTNQKIRTAITNILEPYGYKLYLRQAEKTVELVKLNTDLFIGFPLYMAAETIQRLIFLLSIILSNKHSILVFEEPETHLFPYYTKYIAELIAKDQKNNQYFISTHNPYFLYSLLEKTKREDISLFVVDYKNYETRIKKLTEKNIKTLLEGEDPFFNLNKYFE